MSGGGHPCRFFGMMHQNKGGSLKQESTKEALFKNGEICDSGKPWYCFFGVYLVTLIVNITLLLTSERKP